MNQMQITRQNHYVPIWYQRGFILGPTKTLQYLDLHPPETELPNGRTIIGKALRRRSPKQCFRERDLYTTRFGRTWNDEIEKFLFGAIDANGATAIRAFAANDRQLIHKYFLRFFEYLNSQKLRTPKGLDWIRARYPSLAQVDLMLEMQHLRHMHCTMWVEGVREIVSAENSDVKFIATDHPVTAYNPALPPTSAACEYPEDPSIGLKGTQTVFALDADHCLILSNLEYARDPTGTDLLALRQNARYAGQTVVRTDAMIRTRMLTPEEVVSINSLLKARSRQYVAAREEAWLYPENTGSLTWEDIGNILLPRRDMLWEFGGEIYVGYRGGSTHYQDAFGRTDHSHEFLKKKESLTEGGPNDRCGCGSGRKYKKCCLGVPVEDRPPRDVYGIVDRNRMFCNAVVDILGLNKNRSWGEVRRELTNDQVERIHEILRMLWPPATDIADLLPRPDERVFRAVYMGLIDPRTIDVSVISSLAYFDEIVIVNPFPNPVYMKPEFSPTKSPEKHKSQVLKNASVLLTLQPFIDAGIVHLVPDPMEFNVDFRRALMEAMEKRTANWQLENRETRLGRALVKDDLERETLRLPAAALRQIIRDSQPDLGADGVERTLRYIKEKLANDPLGLLQPIAGGKAGGELHIYRGVSLELALFFAHLTGAAVYTDQPAYWRQLHEHTSAARELGQRSQWTPLSDKLASLIFTIEANPWISMEIRKAGKIGPLRSVFRRILHTALTQRGNPDLGKTVKQLVASLDAASVKADSEWAGCSTTTGPSVRFRRRMELSVPVEGFNMNSVHRLLVTSGRANYMQSVPMSLLLTFNDATEDFLAR